MAYDNRNQNRGGDQPRDPNGLEERVIHINRVAKVVKGGRRSQFTALVVVGDGKGKVGPRLRQGQGSTGRHREGRRRGEEDPVQRRRSPVRPSRTRSIGEQGAGRVLLKPAAPGTGVIAGGAARMHPRSGRDPRRARQVARQLERHQRGPRHDPRPKSLRSPDQVAALRGKSPEEVTPGRCAEGVQREQAAGPKIASVQVGGARTWHSR